MASAICIKGLNKKYPSGLQALKDINLEIQSGEIFALLGPNGAGKTTLISTICGILNITTGSISVDGLDIQKDYRTVRKKIGLVPQELTTDMFEKVWNVVTFSRGLFGTGPDPKKIEEVLRALSLWDKKDSRIGTLSGGMKRRVMLAKALSHDPTILFLDEPTAGVDVNLRKDMWNLVRRLKAQGVTIILTTHYIEEAQELADRVGVIKGGEIILVEEKEQIMQRLGQRRLSLTLSRPLTEIPQTLAGYKLTLSTDGTQLSCSVQSDVDAQTFATLLNQLGELGLQFKDMHINRSSLEEIFVNLVTT